MKPLAVAALAVAGLTTALVIAGIPPGAATEQGPQPAAPKLASEGGMRPAQRLSDAVSTAEPLQMRLLRSVYTGRQQGLTTAEVDTLTKDSSVDYATATLARAVRVINGTDAGFPEWPLHRLLDRTLMVYIGNTNALGWGASLPEGFAADDLVYVLVYALVMSGRVDETIDVLARHLGPTERYEDFKRAVVLQALRNIGDARADELIRKAGGNLAENLLADLHYPFHNELRQRWGLIPPPERTRANLRTLAGERCGDKAALAVYLLGYFSESPDRQTEEAERALFRDLTAAPCYHTRFFAIRALALRGDETIPFWLERFRVEKDAWQRAALARIGFGRFGRAFLQPALTLLATESSQYVQWELMHGNLELRDGGRFRDYWDIWQTTTLQIRLTFAEGKGEASSEDMNEILAWLENGHRPPNEWVRNHMLYGVGKHVSGTNTRRLLRVFNALPDKTKQWWILDPIDDPAALPLLRYWLTLPAADDQKSQLQDLIERLGDASRSSHADAAPCCRPTRACLVEHVVSATFAQGVITSEAEAAAWLAGESATPEVTFLDSLERIASVRPRPGGAAEQWEHVFGCWRRR